MEATKDKLHKFIDDGIRQMLEEKLVTLTNLLLERGISLTSQEKNCIVDLEYDASCYASQLSTRSDESDESDNEDRDDDDESNEDANDDDDDESNEDSDENEDDDSESASHNFDQFVVCNEDGKLSLDMETYRKRLYKLGRCHICGSCDHTGFRDKDQRDVYCPNKKAFARYCLEEAAKF